MSIKNITVFFVLSNSYRIAQLAQHRSFVQVPVSNGQKIKRHLLSVCLTKYNSLDYKFIDEIVISKGICYQVIQILANRNSRLKYLPMLFSLGKYRYYLSNDQILDLGNTFYNFSNNQLFVNPSQLLLILKSEGVFYDEKELQKLSYLLFKEHSKMFYNVYEFIALLGRSAIDQETEQEMSKVFQFFDTKKRNKLTAMDLKEGFSKLGESVKDKDVDKIFLELDLDADGAIDFEQFIAAMVAP